MYCFKNLRCILFFLLLEFLICFTVRSRLFNFALPIFYWPFFYYNLFFFSFFPWLILLYVFFLSLLSFNLQIVMYLFLTVRSFIFLIFETRLYHRNLHAINESLWQTLDCFKSFLELLDLFIRAMIAYSTLRVFHSLWYVKRYTLYIEKRLALLKNLLLLTLKLHFLSS